LTTVRYQTLFDELAARRKQVYDYLFASPYAQRIAPGHLKDAAYSYLRRAGKSLRPAVLLLSCAAVGGSETHALPAAAGIEVYHTWTLVHDDIIDRDTMRRGKPTVHIEFAERGARELNFEGEEADHYGRVIGILAGDVQQSWAYMLFHDLHTRYGIDAELVLRLVSELATDVQLTLVEGETLDVQFTHQEALALSEKQVIDMLRKKTGTLYEFAGRAGAMIGLNNTRGDAPEVRAIARFCGQCGTAFQMQDDILGVIGDRAQTGKPVGADIREGKKTLIVYHALRHSTEDQRRDLVSVLGNVSAREEDIARATHLLEGIGSIEYTREFAGRMVDEALAALYTIPSSKYRDLLQQWAEYLIDRSV
jgi:geranylgeranyl diphosphate synthase type I